MRPARTRPACPYNACAAPQQAAGFGRLLPLLLILSLMANVIDAVRIEQRGAGYSQLAPAPRRRRRRDPRDGDGRLRG